MRIKNEIIWCLRSDNENWLDGFTCEVQASNALEEIVSVLLGRITPRTGWAGWDIFWLFTFIVSKIVSQISLLALLSIMIVIEMSWMFFLFTRGELFVRIALGPQGLWEFFFNKTLICLYCLSLRSKKKKNVAKVNSYLFIN